MFFATAVDIQAIPVIALSAPLCVIDKRPQMRLASSNSYMNLVSLGVCTYDIFHNVFCVPPCTYTDLVLMLNL